MSLNYILQLADNSLILGQRLSEWCGHGPVLEEDIALTNTALDYIGQATNLYKRAAELEGQGRDEDQMAFLRDAWDFRNTLAVELPNGDYAFTVTRQFLFSAWYYLYLQQLKNSSDEFLRGFAEKTLKEVRYHLQHSLDWVKRLGDGTEESHRRMTAAIQQIWEYTGEWFIPSQVEKEAIAQGIAPDPSALRTEWRSMVESVFAEATLETPADGFMHTGGKEGRHTEYLGYMLADMQFLQRAYPGAKW
jgi:ring-1,2-phenylacetyl-CoA epoxidase subunit PaaC